MIINKLIIRMAHISLTVNFFLKKYLENAHGMKSLHYYGPQLSHGFGMDIGATWWSWSTLSPKTLQQKRNRRRWRVWKASAATLTSNTAYGKSGLRDVHLGALWPHPLGPQGQPCTSSASHARAACLPADGQRQAFLQSAHHPLCHWRVVHLNMKMTSYGVSKLTLLGNYIYYFIWSV